MDKDIKGELKRRYGVSELIRLTGGFTNTVYLLKGTQPLLVAKIAQWSNQDVQNEVRTLKFLGNTSFTPKVIDIFTLNGVMISIFTFSEGINGQAILDTGDINRSKILFENMGSALSLIHSKLYPRDENNLRQAAYDKTLLNLSFVPEHLIRKSKTYFQKLNPNIEDWTLTHGDFGSHNVLFANDHITVIDWEWSEWGHPLIDLAWSCWNTKLHYPAIADELNNIFLNSYKANRCIDYTPNIIKTYSLYRLWTILHRVQHGDEETRKKWINRLEWTFETEII